LRRTLTRFALAMLAIVLAAPLLMGAPLPAQAAEVLQVRSATVLQIGDGNRNYTVRLACLEVTPDANAEAVAWLRQQLPRRSRVNLRPVGSEDGILVARVSRLEGSSSSSASNTSGGPLSSADLGQGLVDAGLATWLPNCSS
jgi:hypothetical protein